MSALRPYQQEAYNAVMGWVRQSTDPCLVDAATGAGKSHIIAALAAELNRISKGKKVLCLAPSAELVTQNRAKYIATGNPASVMSASVGAKCMRWPVVFGTPGTVKNRVRAFGSQFCAVVVDEAHGITPTIKRIIAAMQKENPLLRVVGLSATPYRLGSGYIYATDEAGQPMGEHACRDPYFTRMVYRIHARELIDQRYLTPPVVGHIGAESYDTSGLTLNRRGQFDADDVDRAFNGQGRKTAGAIADIVAQSRDRKGVMIFAATVQHAKECMASLPPQLSAIVTGETKKPERKRIIEQFKAGRIKYLVNVSVLCVGFDAEHVDVIALLRATESVGLLQQMIGRGLRLCEGKTDCLVLDYADNVDRHCPDGDLFNPEVKASYQSGESGTVEAECAECGSVNTFSARKNPDQFEVDQYGYFVDLAGARVETDHGPMPAHYGRRCQGLIKSGPTHAQCSHRWTSKKCKDCDHDNDIAARYCSECKAEIIDPNDKLKVEFKAFKRDPSNIQTDEVLKMEAHPTMTRSGKESIVATFTTPWRTFTVWLHPWAKGGRLMAEYLQFMEATDGGAEPPATVTYQKDKTSGFYRVHDYGREADEVSRVA